jgi:hypothetical protein
MSPDLEANMGDQDCVSRRTLLKGSLALAGAGLLRHGGCGEAAASELPAAEAKVASESVPYDGLPFRHIHLDSHTSPAITGVGKNFKPTEFAATLRGAAVNSITIFAKCHHGMAYYPTKIGLQHPNLSFDLLGQMIEACHREKIRTPVYVSTMYDQHAWREHGDWRALDTNGMEEGHRGGTGPLKPQLGRLCINTPYLDYLAAMSEEVLSRYEADGIFYDNFGYDATGCSCAFCIAERDKLGLDSRSQEDRVRHMHLVMDRAMLRLVKISQTTRPKGTYFVNGPLTLRQDPEWLRSTLRYVSHIEIESLPGGTWGYSYFPMAARRFRGLGRATRGMTGAFHRSWGDFGTVRNQAALDYECFSMLAQATMCSVGDHLHPSGQLNKVTYERIGRTFQSIAEKEPWCQGAKAVTEIGSLITNSSVDGVDSDLGVAQILTQLRRQFDIIDSTANFRAYRVLILPDSHRLDDTLQRKLTDYLAGGGKLILSNESGLDPEGRKFLLPIGVTYESPWNHDDQYIEVIDAKVNGLPEMIQIAYETGTAVRTTLGGTSLARSWKSYFDKDYEHFQVEQIPPAQATEYSAAVATSNTVYFATPIFRTYARFGYPFYRDLVGASLSRLLAEPLVSAEGPTTMQATVTEQPKRRIVHLLNYIPERRAPDLDIVEDVIPLSNVKLRFRMDQIPQKVYLAPQRKNIDFSYANGYVVTVVPTLIGHQMIVFEHA